MTELGKAEVRVHGSLIFYLGKIEMIVLVCHFVLPVPLCSC